MKTLLAEPPKRNDRFGVKIENIIIDPEFNVRIEYGDIEQLALSIKESGLKIPLRGYRSGEDPNKFVLVDGHRRYRAIKRAIELGADILYIDFLLEGRRYSSEQRTLDMLLCNDGLNLRPIEQAILFQRMIGFGYSVKEIALKSGRSVAQVYNLLDLSNTPKKVQNLISENKITEGAVISIIKSTKDVGEQSKLIDEAIENSEKESSSSGKVKKPATIKNIKSSEKTKTPYQIILDFCEHLSAKQTKTERERVFIEIIDAAKEKKTLSELSSILNNVVFKAK